MSERWVSRAVAAESESEAEAEWDGVSWGWVMSGRGFEVLDDLDFDFGSASASSGLMGLGVVGPCDRSIVTFASASLSG